jgi:hypothetical protein
MFSVKAHVALLGGLLQWHYQKLFLEEQKQYG